MAISKKREEREEKITKKKRGRGRKTTVRERDKPERQRERPQHQKLQRRTIDKTGRRRRRRKKNDSHDSRASRLLYDWRPRYIFPGWNRLLPPLFHPLSFFRSRLSNPPTHQTVPTWFALNFPFEKKRKKESGGPKLDDSRRDPSLATAGRDVVCVWPIASWPLLSCPSPLW